MNRRGLRGRGARGSSKKKNSVYNICFIHEILVTLSNIILNTFALEPLDSGIPAYQPAGLIPVFNYERF